MTPAELEALASLAQAATPGPWDVQGQCFCERWTVASKDEAISIESTQPDAAFIAAARQAVPALIAEVRRLRGMVREEHKVNELRQFQCGCDVCRDQ